MSARVPGQAVAVPLRRVAAECARRLRALEGEGLVTPALRGQLIRPLVSLAAAPDPADDRLWQAALAVQYAHEASLLHDDVIDGAMRRRGLPTAAAERGIAAALIEGDHLLTTAYRLAVGTDSLPFVALFTRAVERTVAGERRQGEGRGRVLHPAEYRAVVAGKSGELLGAAFAAAPLLRGDARAERFFEAGRRVGVCYQMVDDLLDYCPALDTGKPALGDFRRRLWTWPLAHLEFKGWEREPQELSAALAVRDASGRAPLHAALDELREVFAATAAEVRALLPDDCIVTGLLDDWLVRAEAGVAATLAQAKSAPTVAAASRSVPAAELPGDAELAAFFARSSRSFSFAARLFPARERSRVTDLYAFCRVTDDLADDGLRPVMERAARLDGWLERCRRGYRGEPTGVPVLDRVLGDAARAGVPFRYVEELIAGMRMDLCPHRYESLAALRVYTHRVASVVGLWLTRLWGVHDAAVLERAADLGHAMQLTNIIRDVGADWRAGRLYLPRDLMARHLVDEALIASIAGGAPVPARWRALMEELMAVADTYYARAFEAIPALPRPARAPIAVAALVYQGIHREVRRNGYDNIHRRARTTLARRLWLGARALLRLRTQAGFAADEGGMRPGSKGRTLAAAAAAVAIALVLATGTSGQTAPGVEPPPPAAGATEASAATPGTVTLDTSGMARLRAQHRRAIADERAIAGAAALLDSLRTGASSPALLTAYDGAIRLLRAKHGSWPPARLRHAHAGLRLLDRAVRAAPEDLEVRYLRLVNGYHLPGIFGRGDVVRADFAAVAALLPERAWHHDPHVVAEIVEFLHAHGEPDPATRAALATWWGDDA